MQCPPDYIAVAVMVELGSVIGRQVAIRPKTEDDWTEVANLWALAIGRPGLMKSPAFEEALRHLKRLAAKAVQDYRDAMDTYTIDAKIRKARMEASKAEAVKILKKNRGADVRDCFDLDADEDEPILRRYLVNDTSLESLAEILRQNPNGVLIHRDELVSLLSHLDREENVSQRGFYLTGWNGNSSYTIDRIGRGFNLSILGVCLSVLGGATPDGAQRYISHALRSERRDDGLMQRFNMLVWPDLPTEWRHIDRRPDQEAANAAHQIFERLSKIDLKSIRARHDIGPDKQQDGLPYLRFNIDAYDEFVVWRTKLEKRLRSDELHPAMQSHLTKWFRR
jgi:putative DNA primase/helicase